MCITLIVSRKAGEQTFPLDQKTWDELESFNPGAFGVMWAENGEVRVEKFCDRPNSKPTLDLVKSLWERGIDCAVHMRGGTYEVYDAQPFISKDGEVAIAHNGGFYHGEYPRTRGSDTHTLAEVLWDWGTKLREDPNVLPDYFHKGHQKGQWGTIVVVGKDGRIDVLGSDTEDVRDGRKMGIEENGVWYSNQTHHTRPYSRERYFATGPRTGF